MRCRKRGLCDERRGSGADRVQTEVHEPWAVKEEATEGRSQDEIEDHSTLSSSGKQRGLCDVRGDQTMTT